MSTIIKITPPNQPQEIIINYESCNTDKSITDRAGSFSIAIPILSNTDTTKYVVGTDVLIEQDGHIFRGWVIKPPKKIVNGMITLIGLEGADYTAKTQKIIVTESYTNIAIDQIIVDLFTKYVPWATINNVQACSRQLTIKLPDLYSWDAMEQICGLCGFDWFIDENLDVNFFQTANSVNSNVISETANNYKAGTANFTPDASKLVNRLWVKGSKSLSLPYPQEITVINGTTPIPLFYKPRVSDDETITITIDGVNKTLGIQNIHDPGTHDFLINANEKLLIPDLCVSGTGTIVYRYEYPIKLFLEDESSINKYGAFEDTITVDTDDKSLAREIGLRYIEKNSNPIMVGSVEPFNGVYSPGELIKVEIPSLDIDEYLVIKSVSYESIKGIGQVNRRLTLENAQRDLSNILKDMSKRLSKVETALFGTNDESSVEKYKVMSDSIVYPKLTDENIHYILHNYLVCGSNIVAGGFYI